MSFTSILIILVITYFMLCLFDWVSFPAIQWGRNVMYSLVGTAVVVAFKLLCP